MHRRKCRMCGGRGAFVPALPACKIDAIRTHWIVVERCDACERYEDDLDAALAFFRVAGWFKCANGGEHALADTRTVPHSRVLELKHNAMGSRLTEREMMKSRLLCGQTSS